MPDVTKRVDTRGESVPPRPCASRKVSSATCACLPRHLRSRHAEGPVIEQHSASKRNRYWSGRAGWPNPDLQRHDRRQSHGAVAVRAGARTDEDEGARHHREGRRSYEYAVANSLRVLWRCEPAGPSSDCGELTLTCVAAPNVITVPLPSLYVSGGLTKVAMAKPAQVPRKSVDTVT